ncbi:unnamed protein product [Gemmataceae bacterium]|nr:unnamed protein product [Gemmataceae bacterium]VTT98903.1 unnamed protein product [Gemmataceae bacterium]
MGTATLFGDSDDLTAPRTPVPPWLVRELVALGVREETAAGYTLRQAHGVKAKLERGGGTKRAKASKVEPPLRAGLAEPVALGGASRVERAAAAGAVAEVLAEYHAGTATADELFRTLRGGLYVLTPDECVRGAEWLVHLLGGGHDGPGVR